MCLERILTVIKEQCTLKGVTQKEALAKSGAGDKFVQHIKQGSAPSIEKCQALAVYFGVSLDYLVGNTDVPEVNHQSETLSQAGLAAFAALSPAEQEQIRALVQTLAAKDK